MEFLESSPSLKLAIGALIITSVVIAYEIFILFKQKKKEQKPTLPEFSGTEHLVAPKKAEIKIPKPESERFPSLNLPQFNFKIPQNIVTFTKIPKRLFEKPKKPPTAVKIAKKELKPKPKSKFNYMPLVYFFLIITLGFGSFFFIGKMADEKSVRSIKTKAATIIYETPSAEKISIASTLEQMKEKIPLEEPTISITILVSPALAISTKPTQTPATTTVRSDDMLPQTGVINPGLSLIAGSFIFIVLVMVL